MKETVDVGALLEEFDVLRARIGELEGQLAAKEEQLGWAESQLDSAGGKLCRGCYRRNIGLALFAGENLIALFLLLTGCATPAKAASANVIAALLSEPGSEAHFPAHHLGRHHCDGDLVFTGEGFYFNCYNNSKNSFAVDRSFAELDNNGVQVPGAKYHFNVKGYKKEGVRALFSDWLEATAAPKTIEPRADTSIVVQLVVTPPAPEKTVNPDEVPVVEKTTPETSRKPVPRKSAHKVRAAPPIKQPPAAKPGLREASTPAQTEQRDPARWKEWYPTRWTVLAALGFGPVLLALGAWWAKILKHKQPWRSWSVYRAAMAAKETYSGTK